MMKSIRLAARVAWAGLVAGAMCAALLVAGLDAAGVTRISFGGTLPTVCASGNIYVKTGGSPGVHWCSSPGNPGTWTLLSSGGGGGGGGLVLLDTLTASSSSALTFTGIDSTYDHYRFELVQVLPATDNDDLYVRVSHDGGSTFDSASNDYFYTLLYFTTTPASGAANHASFTSTAFDAANGIDTNSGVDAGRLGVVGTVDLYVPGAAEAHKLLADTTWWTNSSVITRQLYSATANQVSAVDAVRFSMASTGAIASGTIRMYGIEQ